MSTSFTQQSARKPSALKTILLAGFVAGVLDISAAIIVYSYVMNKVTPIHLLQGIASTALGNSAPKGEIPLALAGLCIHFIIAFSFAAFYYLIFPYISFLKKQKIVSGLLYGIFAWCVMNLIVLPLLHISNIPTKWDAILRGAIILMFCIGLPIALIIGRYGRSKS